MLRRSDDASVRASSIHRGALRGPRLALLGGAACGLLACGGGGESHPGVDAAVDAAGPAWWQPKVGEAKNWDVQLTAPIDVSAARTMYDLDLWSLVPAPTTLDYGDGDPVTVPAGALAGKIAELHARTPSTIVICHVETAMLELARPDARKFPGYNVEPSKIPDNPTAPATGSVVGWSAGNAARRWLDTRAASRAKVVPILFQRFALAKQIGCDGVEPSHSEVGLYSSGFGQTTTDTYSWYAEVAKQGHDRLLSTGMKNGDSTPSAPDMLADKFDWMMIERCGELDGCDAARPFINLQKAVFAIDYDHDELGAAQASGVVCQHQALAMIADGIYKDVVLGKDVRTQCVP